MPTLRVNGRNLEVPEGLTKEQADEIVEDYVIRQAQKPVAHEEFTHDFNAGNMMGNIPSSGYKAGADAANFAKQVVTEPVQTAKGFNEVMESLQLKGANFFGTPESQRASFLKNVNEDKANQVKSFISDRYGSIDKFQYTLENDPVGVISDLAGLLSTAGLAKDLSNIAGGAGMKALTSEGSALSKAGAAIDPVNLALNSAGIGVGAAINAGKSMTGNYLPNSMYQSAAKFSTTLPESERTRITQTALDNELNLDGKATSQLQYKIDFLNSEIDRLISQAETRGKSIPMQEIFKSLQKFRKTAGEMNISAIDDVKTIDSIAKKFATNLKDIGRSNIGPKDLQKLKIKTYTDINFDAKRNTGTPVKEESYRNIARDAKNAIEGMVPGISKANSSLSNLYELQPNLTRSMKRIGNKNFISLNDAIMASSGGYIGGAEGFATMAALSILGKESVRGKTAIALNRFAKQPAFQQMIANNPNISKARLVAILAGRELVEEESKKANAQSTSQQEEYSQE